MIIEVNASTPRTGIKFNNLDCDMRSDVLLVQRITREHPPQMDSFYSWYGHSGNAGYMEFPSMPGDGSVVQPWSGAYPAHQYRPPYDNPVLRFPINSIDENGIVWFQWGCPPHNVLFAQPEGRYLAVLRNCLTGRKLTAFEIELKHTPLLIERVYESEC